MKFEALIFMMETICTNLLRDVNLKEVARKAAEAPSPLRMYLAPLLPTLEVPKMG